MKTILKVFAGFVVLGLIMQSFEDEPKRGTSTTGSTAVSSDPACVALRAKMAAPGAVNSVTADDLILAQRCGKK